MATTLLDTKPQESVPEQLRPKKNEHAPIQDELEGVVPKRYVIREISFLMDSDGLQFLYKDSTEGKGIHDRSEIHRVVPTLTATDFAASLGLTGAGLSTAETPLDLGLDGSKGPAFLVFKLDPRLNWRFSQHEAAVTLKDDAHDIYYGGLVYVDDKGKYHPEPIPDCRLVFFAANPPQGSYKHGFNFNVELIQKPHVGEVEPRVLPITIDPDIRFPGGSGT